MMNFKLLSWNIRGIANPTSLARLMSIKRTHNLGLIGLFEPLIPICRANSMLRCMQLECLFSNEAEGGKIWILAASALQPSLLNADSQSILLEIQIYDIKMIVAYIYASCDIRTRRSLWDKLLCDSMSYNDCPIIFVGDFNAILAPEEKLGGGKINDRSMKDFQEWTRAAGVNEISLVQRGSFYTWVDKQRNQPTIWIRLDRGFSNHSWPHNLHIKEEHLARTEVSDHCPLLFTIEPRNTATTRTSSFKFRSFWFDYADVMDVIRDNWIMDGWGGPDYILFDKLRHVKKALKTWNKEVVGNIFMNTKRWEERIELLQRYHDSDPEFMADMEEAQKEFETALRREEKYWRELSGVRWLKEGDKNNKFFHTIVKTRWKHGIPDRIQDETGNWIEGPKNIIKLAALSIEHLFKAQPTSVDVDLLRSIPKVIDDEMNEMLIQIPTADEIKQAVLNLKGDSAPGPDGFSGVFFQTAWEVVGSDVINFIQHSWRSHTMMRVFKCVSLVLIPKKDKPTHINDWRPVSVENFLARIIPKILATRMAPLLNNLLSIEQGAFIKGRDIAMNIRMAQELMHDIDKG